MSSDDPIDALLDALDPEDREALAAVVAPVAGGSATQAPRSRWRSRRTPAPEVTGSYVGGHPFMPDGRQWPVDQRDEPLHFVVQVNFAEVPELVGFPDRGVLQVFVESTDTWGLTFDDTMGIAGLHCRWITDAELGAGSVATADTPPPVPRDAHSPVTDPSTPRQIEFTRARTLPRGHEHLAPHVAAHPEAFEVLERAWDDHEELAEATLDGWDVQVGGWPSFVQGAPRVPEGRSSDLVLGLGSTGLMMWGDVGTAHLFGDPAALASGDVSGLWWEWACS